MYIDSHSHLNDERFDIDIKEVIKKIKEDKDLKYVINIGYDLPSSKKAAKLAKENPNFFASVGMHPHDSKDYTLDMEKELLLLLKEEKVLALGEIGLDYHYDLSPRDVQREVFIRQLGLVEKIKKPIIIHTREAEKDTFDILKENFNPTYKGIIHSFSSSKEMAKLYLDLGFYLSFSGPITFKNATKLKEVVKYVPLERILVETDCPYLTPTPFRGKRNEPSFVKHIIEEIASLKEISFEEVANKSYNNTLEAFNIKQ